VRQAFIHAVDRQAIKDTLYPGALANLGVSPLPPSYFGHILVELPEYNPDRAKKLLAEAGHPNGFTMKDYFIGKSFFYPKMLTLVQEQLKKVGVNVEAQLVEHATYHENIRKNLNPFVLYGGTRITDGDVWFGLFFYSKEIPDPATGNKGSNFSHYTGIDDLIERGRLERDPEKRAKLYHEVQQRIVRDAIVIPVVDVPFWQPRNPKRVQAPFDPEYGEFTIYYCYNYPEMLKILD
jgi:peptide/nickel transport system substrate-binding protein